MISTGSGGRSTTAATADSTSANTVLVSQQASALQRCGGVSLGHNLGDPKSLKNLTPIDELCQCLQKLLATKPADVADYMDSNTSDNNSESTWSCVCVT